MTTKLHLFYDQSFLQLNQHFLFFSFFIDGRNIAIWHALAFLHLVIVGKYYRTYFRKLQNIFTAFYDNCKAILIINSHNPPFYHNQTKVCLKREKINHSQYSVICSRKIPGKLASRPWFWIKRPKMTIYNGMFVFWGGKMSLPFQFQTRINSENFTIFFLTLKLKISYS